MKQRGEEGEKDESLHERGGGDRWGEGATSSMFVGCPKTPRLRVTCIINHSEKIYLSTLLLSLPLLHVSIPLFPQNLPRFCFSILLLHNSSFISNLCCLCHHFYCFLYSLLKCAKPGATTSPWPSRLTRGLFLDMLVPLAWHPLSSQKLIFFTDSLQTLW